LGEEELFDALAFAAAAEVPGALVVDGDALDGAVRDGAFKLLEGPDDFVLGAFEEEPTASAGGKDGRPLGPLS
jgi:hypothetical protein